MDILAEDIEQIAQWGMEADGKEACGVLLTRSDGGPRLQQVENRADEPRRNVYMESDDFMDAILALTGPVETYTGALGAELVVWHTHPGGLVGPSKLDHEYKKALGDTRCLVVTIPSGEAVQF